MLTFAVNKVNKDHKIFLIFYFYSPYPPRHRFCRVGLWEKEGNKQKYKSEKKNILFLLYKIIIKTENTLKKRKK
jgi:hypothetical protein